MRVMFPPMSRSTFSPGNNVPVSSRCSTWSAKGAVTTPVRSISQKINREVQTGHIFRRVNKTAAERAGIFRLEIGIAGYQGIRLRLEDAAVLRIVRRLQG